MFLLKWLCVCIGSTCVMADDSRPALVADMQRDVVAFYARYRNAESQREKNNAVLDLCQLHNQIWSDPRYASIEKLRGLRSRAVFQLKTAQKEYCKAFDIPLPNSKAAARSQTTSTNEATDSSTSVGDLLARSDTSRDCLLQSYLLACRAIPGPDQIAVHAGSFGGDSNALELVNLIEATIHPEHWDFNGGPGHIQYYRPVMALVVRAGQVVHDDMTDLLQGLRDAGQ